MIGCGWQAESQVACIRAALPGIERVVAYCRNEATLRRFCEEHDAEPGETAEDAGGLRRRRHRDASSTPVPARRVAAGRRARLRGRRERRKRRELETSCSSGRDLRLLRLDREREARVGGSDRAGRERRARLARGARAAVGGRGGACAAGNPTRTSSSSSRTGSRRGTSPRPPRSSSARSRAGTTPWSRGTGVRRRHPARPAPLTTSGRSSRRFCCCGVSRFWT